MGLLISICRKDTTCPFKRHAMSIVQKVNNILDKAIEYEINGCHMYIDEISSTISIEWRMNNDLVFLMDRIHNDMTTGIVPAICIENPNNDNAIRRYEWFTGRTCSVKSVIVRFVK
jgi:hypothetical protein